MRMCALFGTKTAHLSWTKFFGTNHYYFHLPIGRFHCEKLKKILTTDPELWRRTIFGPKVVHLPQTIFFWKIITTILIYLLAPFIVQNLKKKNLQRIQSYEDVQFMGPKWPISPNKNFFRKPVNQPCFFYSCLSTCQKSKSEILMIKEYWNIIGWEPFLSLTWEIEFSQACSFCRMLMNHKNSDFIQIPDKTNHVIFLKSPKTMFLGPFLTIFTWWRFFPKNPAVTHDYIWAPNIMLSFRKN